MVENHDSKPVKNFLSKLSEAYLLCGKALQNKLPLQHPVLKALGALDPTTRGDAASTLLLRQLMSVHLRGFIPENIAGKVEEAVKFNVDTEVTELSKQCTDPLTVKVDVLKFWCHPLIKREYPCLYHMTRAAFTVFHGPRVESSFSQMQSVLASSKSSTHISTFSAIQTIKYHLSNNRKNSIELFGREDKCTLVDKRMCADIRASHGRYQHSLSEARVRSSRTVLSAAQYDRAVKRRKAQYVEKEMKRKRKSAMLDLIERLRKRKKRNKDN